MGNKKFGYTLIELLITISIIGVVAASLIPILQNLAPGKDKAMVRKSYFTIKNVISMLLNDPTLYYTEQRLNDQTKDVFFTNFKKSLKTNDSLTATAEHFATSVDGVEWYQSGSWSDSAYNVIIYFDVNGDDAPNCTQYTSYPTGRTICAANKKPDTFAVGVRSDGKTSIFASTQTYMASILSDSSNVKREN